MDLEGIAWILILFFYFVARAIGGKKKGSKSPGQPQQRPPAQRKPARIGSTGHAELDDALAEIRRALGFPDTADRRSQQGDGAAGEPGSEPGAAYPEPTREEREQVERSRPRVERPATTERVARADRPTPVQRPTTRERPVRAERPTQSLERPSRQLERPTKSLERPSRQVERLSKSLERPSRQVEDRFRRFERPLDTAQPPRKLTSAGRSLTAPTRKSGARERPLGPGEAPDRSGAAEAARQRRSGLMRALQEQGSLRDAFIMKELFDRPLALRRRYGFGRRD